MRSLEQREKDLDMVHQVKVLSFDGFQLELEFVNVDKSIHDDGALSHLHKQQNYYQQ